MGEPAKKEMTAAEAAKLVKRAVTKTVKAKDGGTETRAELVSVAASEVLSFKDYGTHVVVVTVDGQKLFNKAGE